MKKSINITNIGTNHSLESDTLKYVKDILADCNFNVDISSKPKKNCLNIIPEGFNHNDYIKFRRSKNKFTWGLIRTELYVNNNLNILNGSYNLWSLHRKLIDNKKTNFEFDLLNFIYFFKKKSLNTYLKNEYYYSVIKKFLRIKKRLKNFNKIKIILHLIKSRKIKLFYLFLKIFKISKYYYNIIKSPHEVDHFNSSLWYKIFCINSHWKDLFTNTYKEIDSFKVFFNFGLDEGLKIDSKKQITLPLIFLNKYDKKKNSLDHIDKEYDIFFSGLLTDYRLKIYEELKKYFKVKFVSYIEDENKRLILNKKSKISIYLKKEDKQSIFSVMRYSYALENNIPTIFEADKYCVPQYFKKIAITFERANMISTFKQYIDNYENFLKEYNQKILYLKNEFTFQQKQKIVAQMNELFKNLN